MTLAWPLLLLALPAAITVAGGRSAWLWLSVAAVNGLFGGVFAWVTWNWANGRTGVAFEGLVLGDRAGTAFHDTYYVVADGPALAAVVLPGLLIGLLLFLPGHPRRHGRDIALFWAATALFSAQHAGLALMIRAVGMPRRHVDYPEAFATWTAWSQTLGLAALLVCLAAAWRPLRSWWRHREAG